MQYKITNVTFDILSDVPFLEGELTDFPTRLTFLPPIYRGARWAFSIDVLSKAGALFAASNVAEEWTRKMYLELWSERSNLVFNKVYDPTNNKTSYVIEITESETLAIHRPILNFRFSLRDLYTSGSKIYVPLLFGQVRLFQRLGEPS